MPHPPPEPGLRLQLLRNPQLLWPDGRALPLSANDAALLALLAIDGATSRDRVIALLWADEDDASRARNALRQRLFRLRRLADSDIVNAGELLALAPGVVHDLQDIDAALAADPAGALSGDLLGVQDHSDSADFADWLAAARAQWRSRRREALAEIASRLEAGDRIAEALVCAERLARDEPLLEHAQRRLMRLHYRRGDRGAALASYARFGDALKSELGESPSAETRTLAKMIVASGALPVAASPQLLTLLRPPRLVGRAAEWQRIEVARAQRRTVLVLGEPGIGKSRLVGDFAAAHALFSATARPGDARVPYALLARLIRALDLSPTAKPRDAPMPMARAVDGSGAAAKSQIDDWARAELARFAPELGKMAAGRADAGRLQQALEHAVQRVAPDGAVLDDLHFADAATLALLPALVAGGGAWLLALRAHEMPAPVSAMLDALDADRQWRIELGPLDPGAVLDLLESLALPGIDASMWAQRVHHHSGGNPLFILETLRALLAGNGAVAADATLPLPDKLRQLIERRLTQLSPQAIKLARLAAVAGQDFHVDLAAAVLEVHALDLLDAWRELEAVQVLQGSAFAHDLIFEVTRDAVPAVLRRWLHARVAQWLDAHHGVPGRLALHWREAGEPGRAAQCCDRAALAAALAGRLAEQARWLDAAIEAYALAGRLGERFDAMTRRAVAAREATSPAVAMQSALQLMAAASGERQRGIAHTQIAACHMNAAQFDLALPVFDRAIAESTAAGDEHNANHARYLQAVASAQIIGLPEALRRIEPLMSWAEAQPDESLRHSFLADLAVLYDQADQRRRAGPFFIRALTYFDRQRETGNSAPTRMMYARSLIMLGHLAQARTLLEAAVRERAESSEGAGGYGVEVLNLGRVYCELGLYAEALALLEPTRARLQGPGSEVVHAATALVMARVQTHLGQAGRAMALFKEVPADVPFHQQATLLWTRALLQHDQPFERVRLLDLALALFSQHADLPYLRLPIEFDRWALQPGEAALQRLRAGVAECQRRELPAPQMLGRMRLLQVLCAMKSFDDALAVGLSLQADLAHCQPVGCYLPELHAACRSAALGAGDRATAQRCQDAAVRWIAAVSQQHVPEAFRDSFAHRNPINRAVLTTTLGA